MGTPINRAKAFATNVDGPTATEYALLLVVIIAVLAVIIGFDRPISIAM
jgi:Flp pilus assembly pilin Flp